MWIMGLNRLKEIKEEKYNMVQVYAEVAKDKRFINSF